MPDGKRESVVTGNESLRDRIAAAIYVQKYPNRCAKCLVPHPSPWAYTVADAVIAALGLRQERVKLLTRYVTDWSQDG